MRHIPLNTLIKAIFADADGKKDKQRLDRAHKTVKGKEKGQRQGYIDRNGSGKWSLIKNRMTTQLGNKCWYTEAELVGADLTIDHFRPKCDYWWLAFDVENYRVACPYSNSPKHNAEQGRTCGKGDAFPLLPPGVRATCKSKLIIEKPVILDPCSQKDCDLVAFEVDGRPILNPNYAADPVAVTRVNESKILLNLDHPHFNSKREQLCLDIEEDVLTYEDLPAASPHRNTISKRIEGRLASKAAFSSAARHYLQFHRHLKWVDELLQKKIA